MWSEHPNPTGLDFTGVFAVAPDDVWFGGPSGSRLARWDGSTMEEVILSANGFADLDSTEAIWGGAPDDVWAVGTGTHTPTGDGRANGITSPSDPRSAPPPTSWESRSAG